MNHVANNVLDTEKQTHTPQRQQAEGKRVRPPPQTGKKAATERAPLSLLLLTIMSKNP